MALPGNAITAAPIVGEFLPPRNLPYEPLTSRHYGGVALNDPSEGRLVKVWSFFWTSGKVLVADGVTQVELFPRAGVKSVSGAFDNNMAPVVAFRDNTGCYVWFFNPVTATREFLLIPGATSIQCVVDDLRKFSEAASDVIVGYTKPGALYWRQQRDRYGVERLVNPANGTLVRLGMSSANRLQFEINPRLRP